MASIRSMANDAVDGTRYIHADDLLSRLERNDSIYVFDVRAVSSYQEAHIQGAYSMPYGESGQDDLAGINGLKKDSPVVTYCGCPHHLASLGAQQFREWGYSNVRILYEGFWYWYDAEYPMAGPQNLEVNELQFAGTIRRQGQPLANTEVFIRALRNGQLEAAATDANGVFSTAFHVIDAREDDQFEIRIGTLESPVADVVQASPGFDVELDIRI